MNHFFEVTFIDNDVFTGDPLNGDWKEVPETRYIKKIVYSLGNRTLTFEGYAEYNHCVEHVATLQGHSRITKVMVMCRDKSSTTVFTFNIDKGKITRQICPIGQEYGGQILTGWKPGEYEKPKAYAIGQ